MKDRATLWLPAFAGLATAVLLVAAVIFWPGTTSQFAQESVAVPLPANCTSTSENGSTATYAFHGVVFRFHVTGWCSPAGGGLVGNGTETGGQAYSFYLSGLPAPQAPTWYAPDGTFGISWNLGSQATLMVKL